MLPQTDPQLQHSCIHSTNEWDANVTKVTKRREMRTVCGTILAAVMAALSAHGAFNVRDFGAKGDGTTKDTAAAMMVSWKISLLPCPQE